MIGHLIVCVFVFVIVIETNWLWWQKASPSDVRRKGRAKVAFSDCRPNPVGPPTK